MQNALKSHTTENCAAAKFELCVILCGFFILILKSIKMDLNRFYECIFRFKLTGSCKCAMHIDLCSLGACLG